jgi:hypothetical protein
LRADPPTVEQPFAGATELNQAIIVAIEAITGDKAPWMKTSPAYLHLGI